MIFFRALIAFFVLPGIFGIILPPLFAALDPWRIGPIWQGGILMVVGLVLLIWCVRDFYAVGKGTLAPWDPPQNLVVVGMYRYMRNPMYVGVITLVGGWAVAYGSPLLALYAAALAVGFHVRVVVREEPWLRLHFGDDWAHYCANVDRWVPRLKPWRGGF